MIVIFLSFANDLVWRCKIVTLIFVIEKKAELNLNYKFKHLNWSMYLKNKKNG